MVRTKQPVLVGLPKILPGVKFWSLDKSDLDHIRDVLNEKQRGRDGQDEPTPVAAALIRLMQRLEGFGGNLKRLMDSDDQLCCDVATACMGHWDPSESGRAYLRFQPSPLFLNLPGKLQTPERWAAMLFAVWSLNPEWDKLAGPCARCGRYYLKKRQSQKVYCSRRCGNAATAVERTRERLKQERDGKLRQAGAAVRQWRKARTEADWKTFVSQRTGIDRRFLTRHQTELQPPKKEK
jgi:hypothetical protein